MLEVLVHISRCDPQFFEFHLIGLHLPVLGVVFLEQLVLLLSLFLVLHVGLGHLLLKLEELVFILALVLLDLDQLLVDFGQLLIRFDLGLRFLFDVLVVGPRLLLQLCDFGQL